MSVPISPPKYPATAYFDLALPSQIGSNEYAFGGYGHQLPILSALIGGYQALVIRFRWKGNDICVGNADRLDLGTKGHKVREGLKVGYMDY